MTYTTPGARRPDCRTFSSRAFTLVELLVGMAVTSILVAAFASIFSWHTVRRVYNDDQSLAFREATAVLIELQATARAASYGMPFDADATGFDAVGACAATNADFSTYATATAPLQYNCSATDNDQALFAYGDPMTLAPVQSLGSSVASYAPAYGNPTTELAIGGSDLLQGSTQKTGSGWMFVGGICANGSATPIVNQLYIQSYENVAGANYLVGQVTTGQGADGALPTLGCASGLAQGFRVFLSTVLNFRAGTYSVKTSGQTASVAMTGFTRFGRLPTYNVTAGGSVQSIENFHVRYGFDLSTPLDGRLDSCPTCLNDDPFYGEDGGPYSWCRDPRAADLGGTCVLSSSDGALLTSKQLRNRIVAVYFSFTVRSAHTYSKNLVPSLDADGYRRWPFSTSVLLRNRQVM